MKKLTLLFPLVLSACFPVVFPVVNPADKEPNVYGSWRVGDVENFAPADLNAVITINNSNQGFSFVAECKKVVGRYTLGESSLVRFGEIRGEGRCADGAAENKLESVLAAARSYRLEQNQLELLDAQGTPILVGKRLRSERSYGASDSNEVSYLKDARRN